ncbi:hypothetical protein ACOSP7_012237 [Xanthoceras sorbifolium]
MAKSSRTIDSFFKRKDVHEDDAPFCPPPSKPEPSTDEHRPSKSPRVEPEEVDNNKNSLVRDPGLRQQICDYPINEQDEIRRAYIKAGPYQFQLSEYPFSKSKHPRRFQFWWFEKFHWLEYSPSKDAAFCLPCFLFAKPGGHGPYGSNAFTLDGFRNWKKVNDGIRCAFKKHVTEEPCSAHNVAVQSCNDLMNQGCHIDKAINRQTSEQIMNNRLRLKSSIDSIRWLTFQGCAFRGHDESLESKNRGNFIELLKILANYNDDVAKVVLENAPKIAKYTSPKIQKEIVQILSNKVRMHIREEIGDAKFCVLVDEARDVAKKEQMALGLRFVDKEGFIRERFLDIVHVKDTTAITLKKELCTIFSRHALNVQNIRGQGYDGASNMRGEWNGLQALFLSECPYAYYIHCMTHRLQLALVGSSREVIPVYQFFSKLTSAVNIIGASCKRNSELQSAQKDAIEHMITIDELETGKGANQLENLQKVGDTRWGSHFHSICSLLRLFGPTCVVLQNIINDGSNYTQRGDADAAYDAITSFEFIFILHLMKEIMGFTDILCQALQQKSQDISNAMHFVSTTKALIQNMREDGWESLLKNVNSFCSRYEIDVPNMSDRYLMGRGRSSHKKEHITIEHHYRVEIFTATIDSQLQELNNRFSEQAMELLTLSSALDPRDSFKSFNIDNICKLADKFYPMDFTEHERDLLSFELKHYKLYVSQQQVFQKMSTISELCRALAETRSSHHFPLIDRLIRLILTLPVSTATTERAFSAMKLVKTGLRNKMDDKFLANYLVVYIEKEIAEKFSSESIIDDFMSLREHPGQL